MSILETPHTGYSEMSQLDEIECRETPSRFCLLFRQLATLRHFELPAYVTSHVGFSLSRYLKISASLFCRWDWFGHSFLPNQLTLAFDRVFDEQRKSRMTIKDASASDNKSLASLFMPSSQTIKKWIEQTHWFIPLFSALWNCASFVSSNIDQFDATKISNKKIGKWEQADKNAKAW